MWYLGTMQVVDNCHDLVVNAILWTALALVAVGLRLFTRGLIVKRTGWDDYLMAAAMVSCSSSIPPLSTALLRSTSRWSGGECVLRATVKPWLEVS